MINVCEEDDMDERENALKGDRLDLCPAGKGGKMDVVE